MLSTNSDFYIRLVQHCTDKISETRRRYIVGWGEYDTAGRKLHPFYLEIVMSGKKILLYEVPWLYLDFEVDLVTNSEKNGGGVLVQR